MTILETLRQFLAIIVEDIIAIGDKKERQNMNTADKVINDLAIQLANKAIECANYKALYEEAQAQLQQVQEQSETEKEK